jgi:hypothetical protein
MRSVLALALFPLAFARSLELHHRIVPPNSDTEPQWRSLGSIQVDETSFGNVQLEPSTNKADKLDLSNDAIGDMAWYQVGVDTDDGWIYGSTRAVSYR